MSTDHSAFANPSGTVWSDPPDVGWFEVRPESEADESSEALPGTIGKYRVLGRVGAGAMGVVYKCSQPGLERPVAVKVMVVGRHASAEQIARFQREAWAAAQLAHPNVLQIYDVGSEGELNYFVMEYVDGWSLDRLIGTPVLSLERALRLLQQVARALEAAHARQIIHRDIKPSNILIQRSGQPKLADFGLAKSLTAGSNLSGSGDIIGTPRYMAPEQALAVPEEVDARADVYALGAVMYEMLTGQPPVDGPNVLTILRKLTDEEPVPVQARNPSVPAEVAAICHRALAKDKEDRLPSAAAFAEALDKYLAGRAAGVPEGSRAAVPPWAGSASISLLFLRSRALALAVTAAGVLFLALGAYVALRGGTRDTKAEPGASPRPVLDEPEDSIPPLLPHAEPAPAREAREGTAAMARVANLARGFLGDSLKLAGVAAPRERLSAVQRELSEVISPYADHAEPRPGGGPAVLPQALLLRARASRWLGEYLSAADDLTRALQYDPKNLAAVTERLLANYQLYVLYLGNLNQAVLRPHRLDRVRDDAQRLLKEGNPMQKHLAQLAQALAAQDFAEAGRVAEVGPPASARPDELPDVLLLEADALLHLAEAAYDEKEAAADGPDKETKRLRYEHLAELATRTLRRGLDANRNHVGLLFLQADSFQRRAAGWDPADSDDRTKLMLEHRMHFEMTMDRLRSAASMSAESAVARAILLSNFSREKEALDRLKDAISARPTFYYLYTLQAWLRLQAPLDGLPPEEASRILDEWRRASDPPFEDGNSYIVRAMVWAAAGNWDGARKDLVSLRHRLGKRPFPPVEPAYRAWFDQAADALTTRFLDATFEVLGYLPVPADLHIRLGDEVLQRLGNADVVRQEGLKPDDVKALKGWTHVRMAKACAGKQDRDGVLSHVREALALKVPQLNPKTFTEDGTFSPWNTDKDFVELYRRFGGS